MSAGFVNGWEAVIGHTKTENVLLKTFLFLKIKMKFVLLFFPKSSTYMRKYGWLFVFSLLDFYVTVINTNVTQQPLRSLFVQLMNTNYYKIIKQLKSFKIIIVAPACFGLHKSSSGSSQLVLLQSYNVDIGSCTVWSRNVHTVHDPHAWQDWTKYAATIPIISNNDICNRYQHCNFGKAQAEAPWWWFM